MLPICYIQSQDTAKFIGIVSTVAMKNGNLVYRLHIKDHGFQYRRSMAAIRHSLNKYCRDNSIDGYRLTLV